MFSKTSGNSTGSQKSEPQASSAQSREIAGIWRPLQVGEFYNHSLKEAILVRAFLKTAW